MILLLCTCCALAAHHPQPMYQWLTQSSTESVQINSVPTCTTHPHLIQRGARCKFSVRMHRRRPRRWTRHRIAQWAMRLWDTSHQARTRSWWKFTAVRPSGGVIRRCCGYTATPQSPPRCTVCQSTRTMSTSSPTITRLIWWDRFVESTPSCRYSGNHAV
jgi:hypothetical protein